MRPCFVLRQASIGQEFESNLALPTAITNESDGHGHNTCKQNHGENRIIRLNDFCFAYNH